MEAGSVGSSAGATATATRIAADVQQVERREPKPEERKENTAEAPKPVVNAEGQTTGTLVNVTA
jgi:hypothetical protein